MKSTFLRTITPLLLVCYLLGGHAAAQGLSWCLAADDHAHLEQVAGSCADTAASVACAAENGCPPAAFGAPEHDHDRQSDCHHLPVASPHHSFGKQRLAQTDDNATPAVVAVTRPDFPCPRSVVSSITRHEVEQLPPLQALTVLRTIVLTC